MLRLFQIFSLLMLALAVRPVSAFSLGGPLSGQPGGETWQDVRHGYSVDGTILDGAIMSPKNLTHEYRRNTPVITYGFDPTFINYFGTNGIAAVDAAVAIMNSLPDVSTLSRDLNEYPLEDPITGATTTYRDSRGINYTAQALNLLDMKSYTLGFLVEQLGLVSPERFLWNLRARTTVGPLPVTNYSVIMRNFDPVTLMPSRYVNGSRYTYSIIEVANPDRTFAIESPTDPESALYGFSSVANIIAPELGPLNPFGVFYTYLTRDDIGGLRYIYDRDNLNWETFAPGTQVFAADSSSLTLVTNQDLTTFSLFTQLNPPAAVQAAFPDLVILSNSVSVGTNVIVIGTTVTNERPPWGDPFTQFFRIQPLLQTNLVLLYDYVFQNVITNYSSPDSILRSEVSGFVQEPWSTPDNPIFRTNIIDEIIEGVPSGGILIVPTNIGNYQFTGISSTNVVAVTNTVLETNIVDNGISRPLRVVDYFFFTNVTYAVFTSALQDAPPTALRGGVGKITFQKLGGNGTNFLSTNIYTAVFLTNRFGVPALVTNVFRQITAGPEILFGAADLGVADVVPVPSARSIALVSNAALNSGLDPASLGGPGNIFGPATITFNNVGPFLLNSLPGTATEAAAFGEFGEGFIWGSFDGSTNPPVVFPKDITLEDIQVLITGGIAP